MCVLQLKDMFPGFRLSLPPKRWFKDNYDSSFLEDRQLGLQAFLQNLIAHKDIANWYATDLTGSALIWHISGLNATQWQHTSTPKLCVHFKSE